MEARLRLPLSVLTYDHTGRLRGRRPATGNLRFQLDAECGHGSQAASSTTHFQYQLRAHEVSFASLTRNKEAIKFAIEMMLKILLLLL